MMSENITEAACNLSKTKLPVYYKYRYTFSKNDDEIEMFKRIYNYIKEHYLLGDKIIGGIEHYTKGMMSTKPHCHIHFISRVASDTIRKGIMREFNLIGRCQCCKAEVFVDEGKFWRYPLKQQDGDSKVFALGKGFENDEIRTMRETAYACWLQAAEVTIHKMEKKAEKTSKERLFSYLDGLQLSTESSIVRSSYEYYVEHEENFNYNTVNGYIHIYLLKNKIMSYEKFIEKYYN